MVTDATVIARGRDSQHEDNNAQDEVDRSRREQPNQDRLNDRAVNVQDLGFPDFDVAQDDGKEPTTDGTNKGKGEPRQVTRDDQGRITDEARGDGSQNHIEYSGDDKNPSKVTITNKDGSTITLEKGKNGVDEIKIDKNGKITTKGDDTTTEYDVDGTRTVTTQRGGFDIFGHHLGGQKSTTEYRYNSDGKLTEVDSTNYHGTNEHLRRERDGSWTRTSDADPSKKEPISDVKAESDGGYSYSAGNAHVEQDPTGARHINEKTANGSYEQSFDADGNLTQVLRRDDQTGQSELLTVGKDGKGSLLVYDTNNPDSYNYYDNVKVNPDGSFTYKDKNGQEVTRQREFSDGALNQVPLDPKAKEVAEENAVEVTRHVENGKFVYDYTVQLEGHPTTTLLHTDKPPEEADKELEAMAKAKLDQLEKDYNIKISRDGGTTEDRDEDVPTKTPNLGQLTGLESALLRSQPDVKTHDGKPLEVIFLAEQGPNAASGGFADGHRVVIQPNGGIDNPSSVQDVMLHELAHNGQHDLYEGDDVLRNQYAAKLGFVRSDDGDDWLLVTKDGKYLKSVANDSGVGSDHWITVDKNGNPVDENGKETDHPKEYSNDEARDLALVRPITTYFPNPAEMGAEGTLAFRQSDDSRRRLYEESPDLYQAIKQLDQLDINKTYGLDEHGQPKYIRNPDGVPVPNTPENRQQVQEFERSLVVDSGSGKDGVGKGIGGLGKILEEMKKKHEQERQQQGQGPN